MALQPPSRGSRHVNGADHERVVDAIGLHIDTVVFADAGEFVQGLRQESKPETNRAFLPAAAQVQRDVIGDRGRYYSHRIFPDMGRGAEIFE